MKKHPKNITITKVVMKPEPGRKATKEDLKRFKEIEKGIKEAEELLKKWKK